MPRLDLVSRDRRAIGLGGEGIAYVLVRKRGRHGVGFKVDAMGLTVSAPATMPVARIEALVRASERWILRKIAEWRTRRVPRMAWVDGTPLPFLGESLVLRIAQGDRLRAESACGELLVTVRNRVDEEVKQGVTDWYKRAARSHLTRRAHDLALHAGLPAPRVFLSSALTRWGSCNARREIRLAWRVVKARPALVDYVICHELAHLRHMNHSRAFWAEVERQCPGYRNLRAELFSIDHLYKSF